ncbi:MAG: HAMP domain-containing histidine kinase [Sphingomonadales bacterium]|nr:MAG: HAMP domain-containing histidine kinase [Sphingomonadales bacterium]
MRSKPSCLGFATSWSPPTILTDSSLSAAWAICSGTMGINRPHSVSRRLTRGLAWTGLFGGLSLIIFVSFDVEVMLEQKSAADGWHGEWLEIGEHVVLPLILLMVPMFFAAKRVIRTSLAPLGEAAARMDSVVGTDRSFRVKLEDFPLEVHPFARALNDLLARLDDVAGQREAFAANVAHELRTPLAILMIELDRLGSPDALRLKKDVEAMKRLVGQIMMMAQLEAHVVAPAAYVMVSLVGIAMDATNRFAPLAAEQKKHVELAVDGEPMVSGIPETLAAAVSNLVENGLRVTPDGGAVVISVGPDARICVMDGGAGLSAADLATLSHRFARAGHASEGGAGLGLAIVARIAEIHRAKLVTDPQKKEICLIFQQANEIVK